MGSENDVVQVWSRKGVISRNQQWWWHRQSANGEILSMSSEGYRDKSHCVRMALRCNPDKKLGHLQIEGMWHGLDADIGAE